MATSGSILGATAGSTIVSNIPGITVNSALRTYAGTPTAAGSGFTETLAGATGSPKTSAITVAAAAPVSSYAIAAASTTEGDSGAKILNFPVTRSALISGASTIDYAVTASGSNPANAADFTGGVLASGTISFAAGETVKIVPISIAGDTSIEPDETFTVTISNPSPAGTITAASATGTITNDDAAPAPTIDNTNGDSSTLGTNVSGFATPANAIDARLTAAGV